MITVLFKCRCMAEEASFEVPERREDEDIVEWMQNCVSPALYLDHRRRNSLCTSTVTEYVKLPAPENAPFIGGLPRMDS